MPDNIEEERPALRRAVDEAVRRSNPFASTTPLRPFQEAPVLSPEAQQAYEAVITARNALEEFEKLHPHIF